LLRQLSVAPSRGFPPLLRQLQLLGEGIGVKIIRPDVFIPDVFIPDVFIPDIPDIGTPVLIPDISPMESNA
jgi:hypothetical protein